MADGEVRAVVAADGSVTVTRPSFTFKEGEVVQTVDRDFEEVLHIEKHEGKVLLTMAKGVYISRRRDVTEFRTAHLSRLDPDTQYLFASDEVLEGVDVRSVLQNATAKFRNLNGNRLCALSVWRAVGTRRDGSPMFVESGPLGMYSADACTHKARHGWLDNDQEDKNNCC